jgi:hypothetical protein
MSWLSYAKGIGPNTIGEATEIHRGVYDGFVEYWRPDHFADNLKGFRDQPFEEFEQNDKHYYLYAFVVSYILKYAAFVFSLWALGIVGL